LPGAAGKAGARPARFEQCSKLVITMEGSYPPDHLDGPQVERALLDAAAKVFAASGADATVREVAAAAIVGMGTLYWHFPTRADLVVAVYRHQVDACAEAGPALMASASSPFAAVLVWLHLFVDFLGTKHGLARVWQGDAAGSPACTRCSWSGSSRS